MGTKTVDQCHFNCNSLIEETVDSFFSCIHFTYFPIWKDTRNLPCNYKDDVEVFISFKISGVHNKSRIHKWKVNN